MIDIYYLLAGISYGIFIVQFILSWFGGDTDLDVDLDSELDMNVSDIVSFKGLIHFLMGFSGWMCVKQSISYSIEWQDYLIALIIGIGFVFVLYYLYKLCLRLQHIAIPEDGENLVGKTGVITVPSSHSYYFLTVEINGISQEIHAYPETPTGYMTGTRVMITKFENGKYYFV